ncbi:hypothetical protein GIB67_013986 [Kingdonia uniflora]|uniref:Protein LNK1 n=1 Tax=Kingdonia uniflora TaxID=39325 RepID=A0A7J7LDI8_9MAGN|nr:hypothetical protein GIB67_013986 [Kingdonia uniflora]
MQFFFTFASISADYCNALQLDDIVWDEFGESDDHIVPHPGCKREGDCANQGDCHKKLRHEALNTSRKNAGGNSPVKDVIQGKEETTFPTIKAEKTRILEKGTWSCTPDGSLASADANVSGNYYKSSNIASMGNGFCEDEAILRNRVAATDNNLCRFPPDDISPTDSDLTFFGTEDKENTDLLYFGWPDIENFEDVDRMFRSCDTTFGQRNTSNDEDFSLFSSSSRAFIGSGDAPMPDFKSSCSDLSGLNNSLKQCEANMNFMPTGVAPLLPNPDKRDVPDAFTTSSLELHGNASATLGHSYDGNWFDTNTENKRGSLSKEQINLQKKLSKRRNQSEGKRKNQFSEYLSGGSIYGQHFARFSHSVPSAMQIFPSSAIPQHSQNQGVNSFMHPYIPYVYPEYNHPSHQNPITPTGPHIESKNKRDLSGHRTLTNQVLVQKQSYQSQDKAEAHGEVGRVNLESPADVDSSNVQESPCMSSVLSNEIPLETSFLQLQYVMGQLDIRTKLCIRDSLYRLARNAEQRHTSGDVNSSNNDTSGVLTTEETDTCTEFMDIETDTNPIDRSIAHLLFHRSADPSIDPANDALPFDSRTMKEATGDVSLMITDQ